MKKKLIALLFAGSGLLSCQMGSEDKTESKGYSDIKIVGAMKNVMWKGQLGPSIKLDTISDQTGLYGLGPLSHLQGELLINNGISYVSTVNTDSSMRVEKSYDVGAPFFVYTQVKSWNEIALPSELKTISDVERFIDKKTKHYKRPFAFKLIGNVSSAIIHIQNLPEGTNVSSPDEAHQGQTNYRLSNEDVQIIGFFSTEHQGVFTHHDSFLHMHLITKDESKMGHLDDLEIGKMKLFLPNT